MSKKLDQISAEGLQINCIDPEVAEVCSSIAKELKLAVMPIPGCNITEKKLEEIVGIYFNKSILFVANEGNRHWGTVSGDERQIDVCVQSSQILSAWGVKSEVIMLHDGLKPSIVSNNFAETVWSLEEIADGTTNWEYKPVEEIITDGISSVIIGNYFWNRVPKKGEVLLSSYGVTWNERLLLLELIANYGAETVKGYFEDIPIEEKNRILDLLKNLRIMDIAL